LRHEEVGWDPVYRELPKAPSRRELQRSH
jgi:hypothetical protein